MPGVTSPAVGWGEADRRRLAVLAETFVAGNAERCADLAITAIEMALDPGQVRQLRLALRLLDSALVNRILVGHAAGLDALSSDERERLLRRWADSPLELMRSGFQAWKRLLLFLAYAEPGAGDAANPHWAAIDYRPDRPALAQSATPIVPLRRPNDVATGARWDIEADVAIVGSGAGGGVVAAQLSKAGRSVVVLEAGEFVPEPDMPGDELSAFDRLYLDHGLCATRDGSVAILAGATVGGGTTVNWTTSIPVPPEVRAEWAREHGLDGIDGPQTEADLEVVEREIGVCPPAVLPPKDAAIIRGATASGWEAAPTSRDADSCTECGSCGFGCRAGTKRSGLRAHLAEAARHGARIVPNAQVARVTIRNGRAVGVEGTVSANGAVSRFAVHARQVVVSAGALRTPVVLTRSGVLHPAVGRYLRLHPVTAVAARFDEPVEAWRGPLQAARSLQFVNEGRRGRGFIIEAAPAHPGLMALAFPWRSAAAHAGMMASARYAAPLIAICRDRGSGTVRPAAGARARIDYRVASGDQDTLRHGLVALARIARAAGAREIVALGTTPASVLTDGISEHAFDAFVERLAKFDFSPNRGMVFSAHQMGSARMGARMADHVCDPDGHVRADEAGHVINGLYVADASLFPTAIGVNPMVTVMLLARRVARTIVGEA